MRRGRSGVSTDFQKAVQPLYVESAAAVPSNMLADGWPGSAGLAPARAADLLPPMPTAVAAAAEAMGHMCPPFPPVAGPRCSLRAAVIPPANVGAQV